MSRRIPSKNNADRDQPPQHSRFPV
jgi:hypothetical protein